MPTNKNKGNGNKAKVTMKHKKKSTPALTIVNVLDTERAKIKPEFERVTQLAYTRPVHEIFTQFEWLIIQYIHSSQYNINGTIITTLYDDMNKYPTNPNSVVTKPARDDGPRAACNMHELITLRDLKVFADANVGSTKWFYDLHRMMGYSDTNYVLTALFFEDLLPYKKHTEYIIEGKSYRATFRPIDRTSENKEKLYKGNQAVDQIYRTMDVLSSEVLKEDPDMNNNNMEEQPLPQPDEKETLDNGEEFETEFPFELVQKIYEVVPPELLEPLISDQGLFTEEQETELME